VVFIDGGSARERHMQFLFLRDNYISCTCSFEKKKVVIISVFRTLLQTRTGVQMYCLYSFMSYRVGLHPAWLLVVKSHLAMDNSNAATTSFA